LRGTGGGPLRRLAAATRTFDRALQRAGSGYHRGAMKLAPVAVIVVALDALAGFGPSLGCSREATPPVQPVQPDERPPLPPAAGTPIGHLVDDAGELKLSDDQLDKLRAINDELAGQLTVDDSEMRPDPVPTSLQDDKPRGLGVRAGGQQPGGPTAGAGTFPAASSGGNTGDGSGQIIIPASTVNHVYQQRARHVRDAIKRALGLLDARQQVIARRVLTDHGVDPDTGSVSGGDPGAAKLEDPKLGKPLPREP